MMIPPVPSHLSLSCPQFYHHLRTRSWLLPLYLSMPWSRVNTEYSIHRVQHTPSTAYTEYRTHRVRHTPSTAYTEYCIHHILHHPKIDRVPLPASLSSLSKPCWTQFPTFPQLRVNQWIVSQVPSRLPPKLRLHIDRLLVLLQPRLIMACKCISKLARSQPPSASLSSLEYSLQVNHQPCSIMASKCFSEVTRSRPPRASPHSFDSSLQVYLQTRSITASECISKFTRSRCG